MNRAPRTSPRLVAERKRERERKEIADAAGASKKRRRRRHNRTPEASEDAAAQQLIAEQAAAGRSADADAISDGDELSPSLRGQPPQTPQPISAPVAAVSLAPPPPVSLGGQLPPPPAVVSAESYVPSYRLSREVYTIPDLWRE